jgi:hypothetical protein
MHDALGLWILIVTRHVGQLTDSYIQLVIIQLHLVDRAIRNGSLTPALEPITKLYLLHVYFYY